MKALQYTKIGGRPELKEVEKPSPGAGQVLIKVTAAGACHSDEFIMGASEEEYNFHPLPLTLGHEVVGVVDELGAGTTGVEVGESVLVYGPWGCGRCYACSRGEENNCEKGTRAPGIFSPGGMAEYMVVDDPRHLIPLGDLDPVKSVSLTDAGLTPYHAVKRALHRLQPGSTAVVIGAGGLGHVAIQIIRALSAATVIALDVAEPQLELAKKVGAHHTFPSDKSAIDSVKELTGGHGADVVFDFVGIQPTADIAQGMVRMRGIISVVGVGGGSVPAGYLTLPFDTQVQVVNWGSRSEMFEVLDLARAGVLTIETEEFAMDDGAKAYEKLHAGEIRGRAIVVPTR
ncbi:MAG TPA: NAD(P)-dependent alcohol dehydrogenase [Terrimesophilobacter sp.]|nr:NAD(P)-dependent alcohol dehydrogenase [Terrimesophilobacter sp.]HRP98905.1 NAD(P)-dependent alcohol dehydrogenase [Terrimesophilobacter sp.]